MTRYADRPTVEATCLIGGSVVLAGSWFANHKPEQHRPG